MLVDRGNKLRISPGQQKAVTTPLPVGFISLFRSSSGLRPEVQNIKPRFSISWGDHWGSSRSWSVNIARLQDHIPVTYNVLSRHWFLQNQCKTSQIFDNTWTCRVSVVDTNLRVEWPVFSKLLELVYSVPKDTKQPGTENPQTSFTHGSQEFYLLSYVDNVNAFSSYHKQASVVDQI